MDNQTFNMTPNKLLNSSTTEYGIRDNVLGLSLLMLNICIIILNFLTVIVILRFRHKNAVDIFVLTLTMTDLVKGMVPVPMSTYIYMTDWYLEKGSLACNFFGWIAFSTNSGSMLILTLMSIERFWAVVKPFSYKRFVTPRKVQVVSIIAMIFTCIHSALPILGVGRILPYNKGAYSHFDYSRYSKGTIAYSIFIGCYGLGMVFIVCIMYSFVFYKIRSLIHRHRRLSIHRRKGNDRSGSDLNLKTEKMFSYLTVALMFLFSISWLPFLIVVVASQLSVRPPGEKLDLYAIRIAVVNSMLNPIAYCILCKPYRRGILFYIKLCCSYAGFKRPDSDIWDPWRRRNASALKYRQKITSDQTDGARGLSCSEYNQSSFTDSLLAVNTDYGRNRLPSVLETYDSYRAHKQASGVISTDTTAEDVRLPTVKETCSCSVSMHENHPLDNSCNIATKSESGHSSDSGIDGSPDTIHGKKEESDCDETELNSQIEDTENLTNENHNDRITSAHRRKLQLIDRVQKYLKTKRTDADRRNSTEIDAVENDFLLPVDSNVSTKSRNVSFQDYCVSQHCNGSDINKKTEKLNIKTHKVSLDESSTRLKPDDLINALNTMISKQAPQNRHSNPVIKDTKISAHRESEEKKQSCLISKNISNDSPRSDQDKQLNLVESRSSTHDDEKLKKIEYDTNISYSYSSQSSSSLNEREHEIDSNEDLSGTEFRPRGFSEGTKARIFSASRICETIEKELENSLQMLHRITQELPDFPGPIAEKDCNENSLSFSSKPDRNTVCF